MSASALGITRTRSVTCPFITLVAAVALVAAGCSAPSSNLLSNDPGGDTTTPLNNRGAFGAPAPNLSAEERRLFEIGDSFFTTPFVRAPSSLEARDGLGPLFNAPSCSSCHVLDGRGTPPETAAEGAFGLLVRLAVDDGVTIAPHPVYGSQLQDRSVDDVPVEGSLDLAYAEHPGTFGDGRAYSLRQPTYTIVNAGYGDVGDVMISPRIAPVVFGMGLIEAIDEADIVAIADPNDTDGDGISGRPNYVTFPGRDGEMLGRFGWKANVATVEDQVTEAFLEDIGITTTIRTEENCTIPQTACAAVASGGKPEVTADRLAKIVFYASTLAVPQRRDVDQPEVVAGAALFSDLRCTACHVASFITGGHEIAAVSHQLITPFSDFLLHDMGPGLSDGKPDGLATGSEWRTAPLWGLGLIEEVNGHSFLLHDGRARSIEEAILWHDGEGADARRRFVALDARDRDRLVAFLESL